MADEIFDVIVVGAGVEGSATAYQLSKKGVRVLLLEKFPLPHTRGSSHGQSRITRKAYQQHFYTHMMEYCTEEWEALQQAYGQTILKKIGCLTIGDMKNENLNNTALSLKSNNCPYEFLIPAQFKARYPNLTYGDNHGAVLDPEGGLLLSNKCLMAFQTLLIRQGGQLKDGEEVLEIEPGDIIQVTTTSHKYRSKSLVLCCGPWANKILKTLHLSLPLRTIKITVCYCPEKKRGMYSTEHFPAFLEDVNAIDQHFYGLPSGEYPGLFKIALHHGPDIDPDRRDAVDNQWTVDLVKDYVKKHFPGLDPEPSVVESCIYTLTPDRHPILDYHPRYKNIVIGAGFSGHGFKLSPAVGQILGDLAMKSRPKYDVSHFRMDRFPLTLDFKSNL